MRARSLAIRVVLCFFDSCRLLTVFRCFNRRLLKATNTISVWKREGILSKTDLKFLHLKFSEIALIATLKRVSFWGEFSGSLISPRHLKGPQTKAYPISLV